MGDGRGGGDADAVGGAGGVCCEGGCRGGYIHESACDWVIERGTGRRGGREGGGGETYPVPRCLAMREILISKASSSCCRCLVARIQMLSQKKGARVLTPVIKECRRICAWM